MEGSGPEVVGRSGAIFIALVLLLVGCGRDEIERWRQHRIEAAGLELELPADWEPYEPPPSEVITSWMAEQGGRAGAEDFGDSFQVGRPFLVFSARQTTGEVSFGPNLNVVYLPTEDILRIDPDFQPADLPATSYGLADDCEAILSVFVADLVVEPREGLATSLPGALTIRARGKVMGRPVVCHRAQRFDGRGLLNVTLFDFADRGPEVADRVFRSLRDLPTPAEVRDETPRDGR